MTEGAAMGWRGGGAGLSRRAVRAGAGVGAEGRGGAWTSFAGAARGHWRGVQATFSGAGTAQEVPSIYVPEAFREWGGGLHDWQTHCEVGCGEPPTCGMSVTVRRLVPLAACESINIETVDENYTVLRTDVEKNLGEAKTVLPDGSYSAGTRELERDRSWRIEHCFATGDGERVRVIQLVSHSEYAGGWIAKTLEMDTEERLPSPPGPDEDPLDGRVVVDDRVFATSEPLRPEEATGADGRVWGGFRGSLFQVSEGRFFLEGEDVEAAEAAKCPLSPASAGVVGLPLGAYSRVEQASDGAVVLEAGVVRAEVRAFSRRLYEGADLLLTQVVLGSETAA